MRRSTVIILISIALGACIPVPIPLPQQEPDEFDRAEWLIDIGKSTKAEVIEILGEPEWEDPRDRSLYYSGEVAGSLLGCVVMDPDNPVITGLPACYFRPAQDWWIKVALNENDVVTSVETKMEEEAEAAIREIKIEELYLKAEAGDRAAALVLASEFDDITFLGELAQEGDIEFAIWLANRGDIEPLRKIAEQDIARAQWTMYFLLQEDPKRVAEAVGWLCRAAARNHKYAQVRLGYVNRETVWRDWLDRPSTTYGIALAWLHSKGFMPDNRVAYMWYTLAEANGEQYARYALDSLTTHMTSEEILQAEQMVRDWKPGDCPSKEHRLEPRGET